MREYRYWVNLKMLPITMHRDITFTTDTSLTYYCIAGNFGGELNLVVWWSAFVTAKLKSANISYLHIYIRRSLTELSNLDPPIFLQWRFVAQPPSLIPTNTSGYTVWQKELALYSGEFLRGSTFMDSNKFMPEVHAFMEIMQVKCRSHKFIPHKFLSHHRLQCIEH